MRGENDNIDSGGPFLPSTPALFLPAAAIVGGYCVALALLAAAGRADGALARLCLALLALGGPFLFAHAALRRFTARVDVLPHAVYVSTGFPRGEPCEIPYRSIRRVTLRRGPVGRLAGSGTLVFELAAGAVVTVSDLAHPGAAMAAIGQRVEDAGATAQPPRRLRSEAELHALTAR